jgi:vitamin B12 transporter
MNSRLSLPRAIASLAILPAAVAVAASTDATTVVVTGTRIPTPLARVVADVVVIDAAQIEAAVGGTLEELLREHAGVQISRNGGPGQSAAAFIRGASASNTVVLVDGVRIGSATLGQVSLEGLSLAQIERIEILRGPGSSLYGADAVGGVVQIFTRRGEKGTPRLQAFAAAGGDRSSELQARVSGASGAFDYAVSASRETSDGVSAVAVPGGAFGSYNPDEDGFKRGGGSLQIGFTPVQGHRVGVSSLESHLNAQFDSSFPDPASEDYRNRLTTRTLAVDWDGKFSEAWTSNLILSQSEDRLRTGATTIDRFDTRRRQIGWQNAWTPTAGHTLVGLIEHLEESVNATPLGAASLTRDNDALALSYSGSAGAHRWQTDLRHDRNSVYGNQGTGKLGYGFQILDPWSVRASAGTAFRAPSFNELYFPGFGVPTIRPERSTSVELGTAWREAAWNAQATLFRNRVRDLIVFEGDPTQCLLPGYPFGCARNVGRATLEGASLAAQGGQGPWRWSAGAEFLQARDDATGQRLQRRAAHTASAGVGYDVERWALRASLQAVGARPDGGTRLPAYELLDLGGHWMFAPHLRVEAKLLNALDKRYEPVKDYGAPGRQFWLGLRYDSAGF